MKKKSLKIAIILIAPVFLWLLFVFLSTAILFPNSGLNNRFIGKPPSSSWKVYCYKEQFFCAKFPGTPTSREGMYGVSNGPMANAVVITKADLTQENIQLLKSTAERYFRDGGYKKIGDTEYTIFNGYPAAKLSGSTDQGGELALIIAIAHGRIYQIGATSYNSRALDPEGFFESFYFTNAR